jgi:3-oxosteroid 1-dehydrogenase
MSKKPKRRIKMSEQNKLSRRQFIKRAAIAGAAVASTSVLGTTPAAFAQQGAPAKWDMETDVVIVGYGGAGGYAAINAADAGANVIMIEKYPADTATEVRHTPSSRYAGGICVCAKDAKEGSIALDALSFGTTPKDVCDAWGEGAARNVAYLRSLSANVKTESPGPEYPDPTWDVGEYPELPGGHTIGTSTVQGGGPRMFQILMANVVKRADKIKVLYETPGKRLIQDPNTKEILGVVATQAGKEITIRAKRAVALTTGGFEYDEEMKANFLRGYPSWFYTNPNATGEGIRMGQAVGGALWHMNAISARAVPYHKDWKKGIGVTLALPYFIVNKYGERWFYERPWPSHNAWVEFVNFSSETAEYKASPAWIIYDDTSAKPLLARNSKGYLGLNSQANLQYFEPERSKDGSEEVAKGWLLRGNTPEELALQIMKDPENYGRMKPEVLKETFTRFNRYCAAGVDAEFGRRKDGLVPLLKPPYFAVKIYPGGPNTQGGLKKNAKGQVVDAFNNPIPRLYCAGENGSVYGFLYPTGGGNICEMTIFGQVIGKAMAAEKPLA